MNLQDCKKCKGFMGEKVTTRSGREIQKFLLYYANLVNGIHFSSITWKGDIWPKWVEFDDYDHIWEFLRPDQGK